MSDDLWTPGSSNGNGNGATAVIEKAAKTDEIGVSGLMIYGGTVVEEKMPELAGQLGRDQLRALADNDPIVGACNWAVDLMARRVDWRVQPAEDDPSTEYADFVEECLHDMSHSFAETMSSLMTMKVYGWSYHELVYKFRRGYSEDGKKRSKFNDGRVGWRKWAIRSQDTLSRWKYVDEWGTGPLLGMYQYHPVMGEVLIPISKALLFRTTAVNDNPEGRSLLRNAYFPAKRKKRIEIIEGIGLERDLAGLPVGKVPYRLLTDAASPTEKATLAVVKRILTNIRTDQQSAVIWPSQFDDDHNQMWDLSLLSTAGRRQFDIDPIIARYNQQIAMTFLADFLLLGHERVGSFALGASKIDLFTAALGAILDQIEETVNSHAIPRLLKLNGMDPSRAPQLQHGDLSTVDLAEIGTFLAQMTTAGAQLFPNTELTNTLLELANLPEVSEEAIAEQQDAMQQQHDQMLEVKATAPPKPPGAPGADPNADAEIAKQMADLDAALDRLGPEWPMVA